MYEEVVKGVMVVSLFVSERKRAMVFCVICTLVDRKAEAEG